VSGNGAGVYEIRCLPIGWSYVGATTIPVGMRWRQHRTQLNCCKHYNRELQADWLRFGEEAFVVVVLCKVPWSYGNPKIKPFLREREIYWVKQVKKKGGCYNVQLIQYV